MRVLAGSPVQGEDAGEIGEKILAGTNCGSCVPEISDLIAELSG
jgi:NAD(P)H-nitrite reductase large subunit